MIAASFGNVRAMRALFRSVPHSAPRFDPVRPVNCFCDLVTFLQTASSLLSRARHALPNLSLPHIHHHPSSPQTPISTPSSAVVTFGSQSANMEDARDRHGKTALIWAAYMGKVDAIRELLSRNVDVEQGDDSGRTPLMWAGQFIILPARL